MSDTSAESIEVNDGLFCPTHLKEVVSFSSLLPHLANTENMNFFSLSCTECKCDQREENDSFFGVRVWSLDYVPRLT
jgi:hypothetical protein